MVDHLSKRGAHCLRHNDYVGICLIGIDKFTDEQYNSLEELIRRFQVEPDNIIGHNEVSIKSCPNFSVQEFKANRNLDRRI